MVVENRAGAAGNIGADQVAKAPADGYTLLMGALTSHSINAALYRGRVTDVEKSFAPVSIVGTVPLVFVVNPSVQATSLSQLIALAKSKPAAHHHGLGRQQLAPAPGRRDVQAPPAWTSCTCRTRAAARP